MTLSMIVSASHHFCQILLFLKTCVIACGVVGQCQKCIFPVDGHIRCTECKEGLSLSYSRCRGKNFHVSSSLNIIIEISESKLPINYYN